VDGNNSIGILLDDTWLNKKCSPDTSENFQLKLDEIKKKTKTPKSKDCLSNFITINNPMRHNNNTNNPFKVLQKRNIIENNEEDICEEPIEQAPVNRISVNPVKKNNLHDIDSRGYPIFPTNEANLLNYNMAKNYYTPSQDFMKKNQNQGEDECNVEEYDLVNYRNVGDNIKSVTQKTIKPKFMERQNNSTRFSTNESNESFDSNYKFVGHYDERCIII
jgi:hypothetical protein